ncbi:MAG: Ig-like domain-containing protein [Ilumatobacteraceae bacterium]
MKIEQPNRNPVARNDTAKVVAGRSVLISVLANDSDPDGDDLILTDAFQNKSPDTGFTVKNVDIKDVRFTADRCLSGPASFTYWRPTWAWLGDRAKVTVEVIPVENSAPSAASFAAGKGAIAGEQWQMLVTDLLKAASDPDTECGDSLSLVSVDAVSNTSEPTVKNGTVRLTPLAEGVAIFSYTVRDSSKETATGTVTVTVAPPPTTTTVTTTTLPPTTLPPPTTTVPPPTTTTLPPTTTTDPAATTAPTTTTTLPPTTVTTLASTTTTLAGTTTTVAATTTTTLPPTSSTAQAVEAFLVGVARSNYIARYLR